MIASLRHFVEHLAIVGVEEEERRSGERERGVEEREEGTEE